MSGDLARGVRAPIRWITAVLDLPAEHADAEVEFWLAATGGMPGASDDPAGEGVTVLPRGGDPYLRLHRRPTGTRPRVRLDLHVDDVAALADRAVGLGAVRVGGDPDLGRAGVALASPGGLPFAVVRHRGERTRARPQGDALLDQVCLDVPSGRHSAESAFWAAVTGWEHRPESPEEFSELDRPDGIPLRLLLQRLGEQDGEVRAHLDLAASGARHEVARTHVDRGSVLESTRRGWLVLVDPAGLRYCVTGRDPATGR